MRSLKFICIIFILIISLGCAKEKKVAKDHKGNTYEIPACNARYDEAEIRGVPRFRFCKDELCCYGVIGERRAHCLRRR